MHHEMMLRIEPIRVPPTILEVQRLQSLLREVAVQEHVLPTSLSSSLRQARSIAAAVWASEASRAHFPSFSRNWSSVSMIV